MRPICVSLTASSQRKGWCQLCGGRHFFFPWQTWGFSPPLVQPEAHRWEVISCSMAKRRAFVLLCVALTGGCLEQPGFYTTGTNAEKNDFPLPASWEQHGWWRNEERHRVADGRRRSGVQQGQIRVNSSSLVWCTSQASLQWYKAALMWLARTPAKQCFCWKSLF